MDSKINNTQDSFCKEIELDDEIYILNFEKLNDSQIGIICENKYDYLSLYNYSITLTYDELIKLAKTFRLFDDIDEIFDTIKNIVMGVEFSFMKDDNSSISQTNININQNEVRCLKKRKLRKKRSRYDNNNNKQNEENEDNSNIKVISNAKLEYSQNDSMNLILKIPLLNEKYETIKIEFKKQMKNIKEQYEELKKKYFKIKNIAFPKETQINSNDYNIINNYNNYNNQNYQNQTSTLIILDKIKQEFQSNLYE